MESKELVPCVGPIMSDTEVQNVIDTTVGLDSELGKALSKKTTILSRICPSDLDRLIQEIKHNDMKLAAEHRSRIYIMAYERKIKALEQLWNAELTVLGVTLNKKVIEYAGNEYVALITAMNNHYDATSRLIDDQIKKLNTISYGPLRDRYQLSIDKLIENSFSMFEELIERFINNLKEKKISIPDSVIVAS